MVANQKLFSVGTFDFRFQHLLIIGILLISLSISMMIRSQPANYGFELHEFDPFFNYRATQFLLENGLDSYNSWHDEMSWHPYGRDVSNTSQTMLHFTSAILYKIFGFENDLYNFVIVLPVIFISLSSIVIFGIVRILGGTTAGLISSLLFSISYPITVRGFIGWFKSEPLGLLFGFLALYFLLSGINSNKGKTSLAKVLFAGLFLSFGLSSWGGTQFFLLPISIFILFLPFLRKDYKFISWIIPIFVISSLSFSMMFERPGLSFVLGYGGLLLIAPTIFFLIINILKKYNSKKYLIYAISSILLVSTITLIMGEQIGMPSFRYLNAIDPTLVSHIPLVDSVSEHLSVSTSMSFSFFSILLIFSGIGIWLIMQKNVFVKMKKDLIVFSLIFAAIGVYTSSVFVRLEIFTSISLIILSSIGISIILKNVFKKSNISQNDPRSSKILFIFIIITLLTIPIILPTSSNWITATDYPPTILTGGNTFGVHNNDWIHAMNWLKHNTPEDAVIASWWDYGYWITTLGERKTLADNSTLIDWQIEKIAISFLSNPLNGWKILSSDYNVDVSKYMGENYLEVFEIQSDVEFQKNYLNKYGVECKRTTKPEAQRLGIPENCNPQTKGLDADYILIFMTTSKIPSNFHSQLYRLDGGGDFQKKPWFMKIARISLNNMLLPDGVSGTNLFWENTLLGNLIPFSPVFYVDPNSSISKNEYFLGSIPLFVKDVKYFDDNHPFQLVYASPSFTNDKMKQSSILIYKINKNFNY